MKLVELSVRVAGRLNVERAEEVWMRALLLLALLAMPVVAPAEAGVEVRDGFCFYVPDRVGPCLTEAQRQVIWVDLHASIEQLRSEGRLPKSDRSQEVSFIWPLRAVNGLTDYGYHAVVGFVDHDSAMGSAVDYNCGNRSYDLPDYDYNHQGTDYVPWPFWWYKMDHDQVEIVSAAPGTIIFKADGYHDRNCGLGIDEWNAVYIQHANGSIAWYGHMKNGSVTGLPVGSPVDAGDYLGVTGSSGNSYGPHLHFEVYDGQGRLIDPYAGPCNEMNSESWWLDQRPYYDSAINAVMTHSSPPIFPECPETETLNASDLFTPGEPVVMAAYYRDHLAGQVSEWSMHRPDGSVEWSWNHSFESPPHYWASGLWRTHTLPEDAPTGMWWFDVVYEGEVYAHSFYVVQPSMVSDNPIDSVLQLSEVQPNPFSSEATIVYGLPNAGHVRLAVYDAGGRLLRTLIDSYQQAGAKSITWSADQLGRPMPNGVYFARLDSGGLTRTMKFIRAD